MPPVITDTQGLFCPFPDGVGSQSISYVLTDFDGEHNSIGSPTLQIAFDSTTTQNTLSATIVPNPDGSPTQVLKIKTKAVKPTNGSTQGVISVTDSRRKTDNTAIPPVQITIQYLARPDASSVEITSKGTVVDEDPKLPG